MPKGIYKRIIKLKKKLCHPDVKRHILGVCINCYSKLLKNRNPQYKTNQTLNSKNRYKRLGSKIINKNRTAKQRDYRIEVLIKLGAKCVHCGYDDIRALHIDHTNGDGKKERNIRRTINMKIIRGLIDIKRYQLLCANCNWIKRLENNEGTNRKDYNDYLIAINEKIREQNITR